MKERDQALGQLTAFYDVPAAVQAGITSITDNPVLVLLLIGVFYIFIGTFMESLAQIVLFTAVFLPLVSSLGVDPVMFGIFTVITLEEALRKITSLPADRLGLKNRGRLRTGYCADICVFDPTSIASNCSARNPRRYASGIAHVLVNGQPSMHDGKRTDFSAGQVIRDFAT